MSHEIVLDIETGNSFADVGKYDPSLLNVSLVVVYEYAADRYSAFTCEYERDAAGNPARDANGRFKMTKNGLGGLWKIMEGADRIIGYNLFGFDYQVLNTLYPGDFTKFPTLDLMVEIEKNLGFRLKLDDVAHGCLGTGKSGNGLQAIEFFRRGELDKLREYCQQDVKVTKEVYEFGLANKQIKYKDRAGRLVPVPVDFELQLVKKAPVNLTMPF